MLFIRFNRTAAGVFWLSTLSFLTAASPAAADIHISVAPSQEPDQSGGVTLTWFGHGTVLADAGSDPEYRLDGDAIASQSPQIDNINNNAGIGALHFFFEQTGSQNDRFRVVQFRHSTNPSDVVLLDFDGAGYTAGTPYRLAGTLSVPASELSIARFTSGAFSATDNLGLGDLTLEVVDALPTRPVASLLPTSRSVPVGTAATAFATILSTANETLDDCGILPTTEIAADFFFQTTDAATNQPTGNVNEPTSIAAQSSQSFLFGFTPSAEFEATDIQLAFGCSGVSAAASIPGLTSFLLSASTTPVPDLLAIGATPTNDGVLQIPGASGTAAFSIAAVNVGSSGAIEVDAQLLPPSMPLSVTLCETNPADGQCLEAPTASVSSTFAADDVRTFSLFATAAGGVPFDPASQRINVVFSESGAVRGSTSVAVRTD